MSNHVGCCIDCAKCEDAAPVLCYDCALDEYGPQPTRIAELEAQLAEARRELAECSAAHRDLYESNSGWLKEVNEYWRPQNAALREALQAAQSLLNRWVGSELVESIEAPYAATSDYLHADDSPLAALQETQQPTRPFIDVLVEQGKQE